MSLHSQEVARVFHTHGALVYRRALRLLGTKEEADEATQEIFARVCGGAKTAPPDRMVAWLTHVTTNFCLNRLRDRARRQRILDVQVAPAEDEVDEERAELVAHVRGLLARADATQAQAAVYVYVDGMSQDQAARLIGVTQRQVSTLLAEFTAWARAQHDEGEARS